jgi:hypothetical protein
LRCDSKTILARYELAQKGKIVGARNVIMDGPFPESKETIGGYWFIKADSLEEAADIAPKAIRALNMVQLLK